MSPNAGMTTMPPRAGGATPEPTRRPTVRRGKRHRRLAPGRWAALLGSPRAGWLIVAGLFLVALAIRWPYLLRLPHFTDETAGIEWAVAIWRDGIRPLTASDRYYGPLHWPGDRRSGSRGSGRGRSAPRPRPAWPPAPVPRPPAPGSAAGRPPRPPRHRGAPGRRDPRAGQLTPAPRRRARSPRPRVTYVRMSEPLPQETPPYLDRAVQLRQSPGGAYPWRVQLAMFQ